MSQFGCKCIGQQSSGFLHSLFCSLSSKNITRLQNIQIYLASFVSGTSRFSHITLTSKSFTCFLFNKDSSSNPWYSYTSTSPLASQCSLPSICLFVHLQDVAIKKRCFSRFLFTVPQFINLKFISTSASHMMLQNSGMICH